MHHFLRILFILIVLTLNACATFKDIHIPKIQPSVVEKTGIATASAISVDITPPPGLPMGGYSIMANKGQGFRTRLKARIIYLNDGQGHSTAIVQTDLTAASLLLHHKIASNVAKETGLNPGDIVITASHSHSAPANIFNNDFYNKHMSSEKGLEEDFLSFTVNRISSGIIEAYKHQRPAKLATGSKDIYGYNRNRSIKAYVLNEDVDEIDLENKKAIFDAVNPTLNMIRIDVEDESGEYFPIAAFSSFSVHATALSPQVEVYNADLFAYAQKDLEWYIQRTHKTPWPVVHALTTGTQGDMAPALKLQGDNYIQHFDLDWKQAKNLGKGIGKEAIHLFDSLGSKLTNKIHLKNTAREINIRENNKIQGIKLCKDAAVGSPVAGGAFERRTPWISTIPFFKGGSIFSHRWFFTEGCQGNKSHIGFSFIQPLLEPKDTFPKYVMFQIIQINDSLILPLPFEVTTHAGKRIKSKISAVYNQSEISHVWITSNSNGYFGYTTTVEEYSKQNYEGGHTLYGKYSTPYIATQLASLASDANKAEPIQTSLSNWQYKISINKFLPERSESVGSRHVIQQPKFYLASKDFEENYISFSWVDVNPSEIQFHKPLGQIEVQNNENWVPLIIENEPINDDGYDIEIRFLDDVENNMGQYEMRWYNPEYGKNYRFSINPRKQLTRLVSDVFSYPSASLDKKNMIEFEQSTQP